MASQCCHLPCATSNAPFHPQQELHTSHASLVALQQLGALLEEHLQQTRSVCSWLDPLAVKVLIFKKNLLKSSLNHCLCLQGAEWVCSAFCCKEKSPRFSPSCTWGLFLMHYLETCPGEERVLGGLDKTGCSGEKKCKALGIGCCKLTFQFCHRLAANPGGKNRSFLCASVPSYKTKVRLILVTSSVGSRYCERMKYQLLPLCPLLSPFFFKYNYFLISSFV